MKIFQFKNFSIQQSSNVFRVGTDGVLLGALSSVENAETILEIGTGAGLIAMMVAQRSHRATILALDISDAAVHLAQENFNKSPFHSRLHAEKQDFKTYRTAQKFDLIISNPPYFKKNASQKDILARQQTELTFENLIAKSAELLSENGKLSVIIPFHCDKDFINTSLENGLFLSRKICISGILNAPPKRVILEFGFAKNGICEEKFTIEKSPRVYTDNYLELTKDFHLFPK